MNDQNSTPLTPLQKANAAKKAKREADKLAGIVRPSWRKAIDAKCKDCIYDPESGLGTWRQQTEACTITDCALWPFRPMSAAKPKADSAHDGV